ncbi:MAG: hypothetical protein KBA81_04165 [Rhabdochlamydiaceae bacterium]|nr:hypothetical protein [Rhabdochlamydiaceae bacterium]
MGQSMSTDTKRITPYYPVTNVCNFEASSRWKALINFAKSCTAKITINQDHLGCGVLVGIDRVLVPAHVISATPYNLKVSFSVEDDRFCYLPQVFDVLNVHPISEKFVILQVGPDTSSKYAGNIIKFPKITTERYKGPFLFSTYSGESPSTQISEGYICCEPGGPVQFCSIITTEDGDCGGGYFDEQGYLLGIHVSRSSGMCTLSAETRQAIFSIDILNGSLKAQQLFSMNVCTPMQHQANTSIAIDNHAENDVCFIEEGKTKRIVKINKKLKNEASKVRAEAIESGSFQNNGIPPALYRFVSTEDAKAIRKDGIRHLGTHLDEIPFITSPNKIIARSVGAVSIQKLVTVFIDKIPGLTENNVSTLPQRNGVVVYKINRSIPREAIAISEA